jgi:hypothetical protein
LVADNPAINGYRILITDGVNERFSKGVKWENCPEDDLHIETYAVEGEKDKVRFVVIDHDNKLLVNILKIEKKAAPVAATVPP